MCNYVGVTEPNMAAMSKKLKAKKTILLLDEADGVRRRMERHSGTFIWTANLLESIAQAGLRRAIIKLMPLTVRQREPMFAAKASDNDTCLMTDERRARLAQLIPICLRVFAAIKGQTDNLETTLSVDDFMSRLKAEHFIKPEVRPSRRIGFMQ
jgi:hypothetical protein